jgi:hypothetical protein
MDGIPNSPLDGYFQVKRVVVAFNTLVNCKYSFNIGAGYSSTQNMPPLDCVIANNLVYSTGSPLITYSDTPVNMTYQGNIFYGATLGITKPAGITIIDPKMKIGTGGLMRPDSIASPVIDGALGDYPYVTLDMDGQPRFGTKDIGADEISSSTITSKPLTSNDVGPYKADFVLPVSLNLTALIQGLYNGTTMVPDTVIVELHNSASPYLSVDSQKGVLNTVGSGIFNFSNAVNDNPYYIVVKHRSGVETWSSVGNSFSYYVLSYDMTSGQTQAYGGNLVLKGSKWCIYSGDVNQDGFVTSNDYTSIDNDASKGDYHLVNDLNGDGFVTSNDFTCIDNNATFGIARQVPFGTPSANHIIRALKINTQQ